LSDAHFEALAGDWESSDLFDARDKTVIRWSAALTENTAPGDDAAFAAMKEYFSERDIVELTLFCCLFNAWNRLQDGFHNPVEALSDQVQWQDWEKAEASST
jgi:alkylhydroperoxidase family enzyme